MCVCVCVCVHIHIRIHIDKGANTAQKVFSYNRRCSHTTEEPARAADAAEDDTAEVRQRRQGAPAGPRPKGPGEEADLNICICMRVSRPRGTGSVGASVGGASRVCIRILYMLFSIHVHTSDLHVLLGHDLCVYMHAPRVARGAWHRRRKPPKQARGRAGRWEPRAKAQGS